MDESILIPSSISESNDVNKVLAETTTKTTTKENKASTMPPEVKIYHSVVGKYPKRQTYGEVCAAVQKVSNRLGRGCEITDLEPYFKMWLTKSNNEYNFSVWLLEWAVNGTMQQGKQQFNQNSERANMETL